ncbi:GNAT family N-acetyltransferase [Microlunatus parietis]|uniref:GNAT superfamily N-acetyltransferase n=1 Tax=Microlunatus parietis TaxID=682979 RepID=A0A7Y9IC64_9ACTN|nr:GNAT family N-acetyltransferase [Microlunatus parietis]NYE74223.1 GNAT superfamily N-acetyltransferase [Microlunatus parietis]
MIIRAAAELGAANHQSFFAARAEAAGGMVQHRYGGTVAVTPNGEAMVLFPTVPVDAAAECVAEQLALFERHRPLSEIGWWSLDAAGLPALGAVLAERGFDWGWRPNWMMLDVARLVVDHARPAGLTVVELKDRWWRYEARLDDVTVGRAILHLCEVDGEPVGGLYDMEVDAGQRRRGIGTALAEAVGERARDLGCRSVLLNATGPGEPVYRRVGFDKLGEQGQTWWLPGDRFDQRVG